MSNEKWCIIGSALRGSKTVSQVRNLNTRKVQAVDDVKLNLCVILNIKMNANS